MNPAHKNILYNQLALRGIAALAVFIAHIAISDFYGDIYDAGFATQDHWSWFVPILSFHFLAVEIFFIISGCLLTLRYWDYFDQTSGWREIDTFYIHRVGRLFPMHYIGIALIGWMEYQQIPHPIKSGIEDQLMAFWPLTGLINLLGMNSWGIIPSASWNEPAWTVSSMFLMYIIFPNLVYILRKVPGKKEQYISLIAALL